MKTLQISESEITTLCIFLSHHRDVSLELRDEANELIRNLLAQAYKDDEKKYHELVKFYDAQEKTLSQSPGMQ